MKTSSKSAWLLGSAVAFALSFPALSSEPAAPVPTTVSPAKAPQPPQEQPVAKLKGYASPWLKEVLKLADAGMDEMVLQAFIDGAGTFNLTTEQIIQLKDMQLPSGMISAMMQHDTELAAGLRPTPGPPPIPLLDKTLKPAAAPAKPPTQAAPVVAVKSPKPEPDTIVNRSPAEAAAPAVDLTFDFPTYDLAPEDPAYDIPERWPVVPEQYTFVRRTTSPVRKPFAVQLTSPILVFKSAGRTPNHVLLEPFP